MARRRRLQFEQTPTKAPAGLEAASPSQHPPTPAGSPESVAASSKRGRSPTPEPPGRAFHRDDALKRLRRSVSDEAGLQHPCDSPVRGHGDHPLLVAAEAARRPSSRWYTDTIRAAMEHKWAHCCRVMGLARAVRVDTACSGLGSCIRSLRDLGIPCEKVEASDV